MGTAVEITVASRGEESARAAIRAAFAEIERIDKLLDWRTPGSLVAKINRDGAVGPVSVGDEIFPLFTLADGISRGSGGAFDISVGPVSSLWDFDNGGVVPDAMKLSEALMSVGYSTILIDHSLMSVGFQGRQGRLDLGAIAKGYAVDRAVAVMRALGVRSAIVDAGGDLRLIGGRPDGTPWRIGIQNPREPGAMIATLKLADTAVVTSGDYERFFEAGGVRYHHILDPATGQPARGCQSVTVVAPTAAEADACATAAFVLGPERGIAFLRSRPGVRGMIVGADGGVRWSDQGLAGGGGG